MRKGFALPLILAIGIGVVVSIAIGIGAGQITHNKLRQEPSQSPKTSESIQETTLNQNQPEIPANWKTYTNERYKFSMKYPETFKFLEDDGESVMFESQNGNIISVIIVFVTSLRNNPEHKEYINKILKWPIGYEEREGTTLIRTIKKLDQFDLQGYQAIKSYRIERTNESGFYSTVVDIMADDFIYSISIGSISREQEKNLTQTFNQILSTFRFD